VRGAKFPVVATSNDHVFHSDDIDVEPERVADMHRAGEIQLVDVREPYEWDAGRISGARHVEMERVASQAPTIDRERPVVFYCRGGVRSGLVANAFRRAGYDAFSMVGGITAWAERGLPLEPEDGVVAPH
jgi:rhodanese-related sulfurtransferase